jgi:hypothetical protein
MPVGTHPHLLVVGPRLTSNYLVDVEHPMGVRHDAKLVGGGSQPEERRGLAAEVLMIDRRRKSALRRDSVKTINTQHILRMVTRSLCSTNPAPSRHRVIDMLPHAMCLGLVRRDITRKGNVNQWGRVRTESARSDKCC